MNPYPDLHFRFLRPKVARRLIGSKKRKIRAYQKHPTPTLTQINSAAILWTCKPTTFFNPAPKAWGQSVSSALDNPWRTLHPVTFAVKHAKLVAASSSFPSRPTKSNIIATCENWRIVPMTNGADEATRMLNSLGGEVSLGPGSELGQVP